MKDEQPVYAAISEDMEKQFKKHYKKSRSFNGKTNMLREFEHYNPIVPAMLDKDKGALNCKNGTLDLRTDNFTEHRKEALITKITSCEYDASMPPPKLWLEFLNNIFNGDREAKIGRASCRERV